ncbi:bifunctional adenosylcobinamide kinase/adenosylcobinamide-phosphate guanylyltransferase [uncultured Xylophilus sp.]|uniref:bifunctional adenosylcobinamide kinase/adenosylcobinamide-phosphate guanylyltransferase n=1 Tax=uncultured Xylophilus sp. TaxID=296832 RepID=UPI0025F798F9|nr:bifunctional adenosylcobinamide kinase/adenosylcobinamide-phosphate guanylyltransferase [uncultured Xylophilus sp.]
MTPIVARSELVLGGQKSGKSRRAEMLAERWLAASPDHGAVFVATAQPWDDEMRARIDRHRADRAARLPGMRTVEEPLRLAEAITEASRPGVLVVADCLTLWLSNCSMADAEVADANPASAQAQQARVALLSIAIESAPGPVVLVSNEIGLGVVPMGRETRAFVDALGLLNQRMAAACHRVTLMAAGLPLTLKDAP